jgi:hypothetical protein
VRHLTILRCWRGGGSGRVLGQFEHGAAVILQQE